MLRGRQYTKEFMPATSLETYRTSSWTAANATRNTIVGLVMSKIWDIGWRVTLDDGKDSKQSSWNNPKHSAYIDVDVGHQIYDNSIGLLGTYNKNGNINPTEAQSGYTDRYNIYRANSLPIMMQYF